MFAMQARNPKFIIPYDSDRKLISVLVEGVSYGVEIIYEIHYPEVSDLDTQVFALEFLSSTELDTRISVTPDPEWKRQAFESASAFIVRQNRWGAYGEL